MESEPESRRLQRTFHDTKAGHSHAQCWEQSHDPGSDRTGCDQLDKTQNPRQRFAKMTPNVKMDAVAIRAILREKCWFGGLLRPGCAGNTQLISQRHANPSLCRISEPLRVPNQAGKGTYTPATQNKESTDCQWQPVQGKSCTHPWVTQDDAPRGRELCAGCFRFSGPRPPRHDDATLRNVFITALLVVHGHASAICFTQEGERRAEPRQGNAVTALWRAVCHSLCAACTSAREPSCRHPPTHTHTCEGPSGRPRTSLRSSGKPSISAPRSPMRVALL